MQSVRGRSSFCASSMHTPDPRASHAADVPETPRPPASTAGGSGGRRRDEVKCTICTRAIQPDETEFELEFNAPVSGGAARFRLHSRCFAMWEELHAGPWATRTRHEPLQVDA
jgi:hypothetical protein